MSSLHPHLPLEEYSFHGKIYPSCCWHSAVLKRRTKQQFSIALKRDMLPAILLYHLDRGKLSIRGLFGTRVADKKPGNKIIKCTETRREWGFLRNGDLIFFGPFGIRFVYTMLRIQLNNMVIILLNLYGIYGSLKTALILYTNF